MASTKTPIHGSLELIWLQKIAGICSAKSAWQACAYLSVLLTGFFAQGGRDAVLFTVLSPVVTILSDTSFGLHGCYSKWLNEQAGQGLPLVSRGVSPCPVCDWYFEGRLGLTKLREQSDCAVGGDLYLSFRETMRWGRRRWGTIVRNILFDDLDKSEPWWSLSPLTLLCRGVSADGQEALSALLGSSSQE